MFIKIVFFFLISNVVLGVAIDQLNSDPINNPNTTIFSSQNITSANVTSTVNVTEFHSEQFAPLNETGDPITTAAGFFDAIDFLNIGELLEFVEVFDVFFAITAMGNMLDLVGVEFPDGVLTGISVILTFAAIMWFIFVIFKVGASSFN